MSADFTLQVIPHSTSTAAANMAMDEGMLENLDGTLMALRCYGWSEPAWTFGYSQRWREVAAAMPEDVSTLIRRPTGGGIVDHRRDFTYCLALPTSHPWWRSSACDVYQSLHQALANALKACGFETRQQPCDRNTGETPPRPSRTETAPKACFTAPETSDLVHPETGRKWAGAALKRSRSGLLIQGSLQPEPMPAGDWQSALRDQLPKALANTLKVQNIQPAQGTPAIDAQRLKKYQSTRWNQKR